jgi:hypothetical protein
MYCTKQQTTCSLNTAVRMAIIKKLMGQVLLAHPVILVTREAEIWRINLPDQHYQRVWGTPPPK